MKNETITADEAREMKSNQKPTLGHRLSLAFWCGIINQQIRKAAKHKNDAVVVRATARAGNEYFKEIESIYENLGYRIRYRGSSYEWVMEISW